MSAVLDRIPPYSLEAEQSVLGSMLIEREAIVKAMEILRDEDFYREAHRTIFRAMCDLFEDDQAVDLITVHEKLKQKGTLDDVGGVQYITELVNVVPTAANVEHYARIVEEKALLRRLSSAATQIVTMSMSAKDEVAEILDKAEQLIFQISMKRNVQGYAVLKDILIDTLERIEFLYANKGSAIGVATGFTDLDTLTAGFQRSDLIILAARPSVGKSAFVLSVARQAAVENKLPVGLFSLEMSKDQLAQRILCSEAGIDGQRLRTGYLQDDDWRKLSNALGRLGEAPMYIDDTPNMGLLDLRTKARRMKAEHNIGLLLIDYLQLMHLSGKVENRQQEIAAISRSLKALARELQVPVLTCSQLSRQVEQREGKRPMLSDLRECLTGDSLVELASGEVRPIADLVGQTPRVVTLNGWKMATARATRVWKVGERPVFRLTTRTGRTIRATANHPFRQVSGWTPLGELKPGERIAIPKADSQILDDDELQELAFGDVVWDEVMSIEPDGNADVYDMEVPETRNFVANGIAVHNSGAIEQDADVVMFLHNPEDSGENVLEIIVAKQRNGPTGSVKVFFQKSTGRFHALDRRTSE